MTRQRKNKIIGLILLLVFSLNTVVGFACSIGVDMGYNDKHHQHDASNKTADSHSHAGKHQHDHGKTSGDSNGVNNSKNETDCCTNGVTDFIKLDKSIAGTIDLQPLVSLVAFVSSFLLPAQESTLPETSTYGYVRRSWRLSNDTDLRIVIQSFQI